MSSPTVTAAPPDALPRGADFADWLSPILVKELRQGLKTKIFIITFILIQVVMILFTGLQLLQVANGGTRGSGGFSWVFAVLVWIPLIILMPARGLVAVSEEVKVNTLDLVQLTRLTAFRIVLGKWVALIAQTLLLVTAILPYAVLRYFFGEVDIVHDLALIGILLLASMVLTAGALALSSAHLAVRILVVLVLLPTLVIIMGQVFDNSSIFDSDTGWIWMLPLLAVMHIFLLLEIAASRIAPISENHSGRKRLVVLAMALIGLLLVWVADEATAKVWFVCIVAASWVTLEALSERTQSIPSLYGPFARRGFLGRLAGRALYPGWASALIYTALLVGIIFAIGLCASHRFSPLDTEDYLLRSRFLYPLIFTALVTPVIVIQLFPGARQPVWLYLLTQAMFGLFYVIANVAGSTPELSPEIAQRWLAPFPTSVLFALMGNGGMQDQVVSFFTVVTLPVCGIILVYLACRAMVEFRAISRLEDQSIGEVTERAAPAAAVTAPN